MRLGFTYKGRHSSEFGITANTKSRPVLPEMKYSSFESPASDGVYDFSSSNEYGHAFYNDRFFEILIHAAADNMQTLEKRVSKIAVWLRGSGELIFDDMPNVKWKARFMSELGFAPESKGKTTVMTAVFRVEPFSECVFDTAKGPVIDAILELDTNIPIDIPDVLTWSVKGGEGQYASVTKTLRAVNAGNVEVMPLIRINGDVKNVLLARGKQRLALNASGSGFVIDCKKHFVTDAQGRSVMTKITGSFPELGVGVNNITLSMQAKGDAEVRIEYTPRFVYNFDFDDVEWGESNA